MRALAMCCKHDKILVQVAGPKSWELPWLVAITERVFSQYLANLCAAMDEEVSLSCIQSDHIDTFTQASVLDRGLEGKKPSCKGSNFAAASFKLHAACPSM